MSRMARVWLEQVHGNAAIFDCNNYDNNVSSSEIVRSLGGDSSNMTIQFIALSFLPYVSKSVDYKSIIFL